MAGAIRGMVWGQNVKYTVITIVVIGVIGLLAQQVQGKAIRFAGKVV